MKKFKISIVICFFIVIIPLNAQEIPTKNRQFDIVSIGLGVGLDHGGIGGNILFYPSKSIGLFGGLGYAIAGPGFNAGAKLRLVSKKPTSILNPYVLAMYGYNAVIFVTNATEYNKFFYGPTFGIGLDFRTNSMRRGYWYAALLVPIRSSEVDNYITDLKNNHGIEFKNELFPLGISFGYRFILSSN